MLAFLFTAAAHDPSPALFTPSTAPGDRAGELRVGAWVLANNYNLGGPGFRGELRWDRLSAGGQISSEGGEDPAGSVWVGVALVNSEIARVEVFGEAGTHLRPGMSAVFRTRSGGIGGHGYQFDLAWGPAWGTNALFERSWSGPFDVPRSMPEGGVSFTVHPAATQALRVGFIGPMPMVSYRLDLRKPGRVGFVLQSSLGTNLIGGVATFTLGWGMRRDGVTPRPQP